MTKFYDTVIGGKLSESRGLAIKNHLSELEGKKVTIEIKQGGRRSTNQNAFYWGIVIPCVQELFLRGGETATPEEVHCYLKEHVLGMVKVITLPNKTRQSIVQSSTSLSTSEWEENIEKIRAWAAQWECFIPYPNEHELNLIYDGRQLPALQKL